MRAGRLLVAVLAALWVLAAAGLTLAGGERWWVYVALESSPMTWLQSVVLVLAGCAGLLLALAARAAGDREGARAWVLLGPGLLVLAVDERFALHERLRDRVLAPRDVGPQVLAWVAPGDVVLFAVGVAGLALLPLVWRGVRADRAAGRALALAVFLSVGAVLADSVDPQRWGVAGERLEQTVEEVVELAAGLCLLAAAALPLLRLVLTVAAAPATEATGPPAVTGPPGDTGSLWAEPGRLNPRNAASE